MVATPHKNINPGRNGKKEADFCLDPLPDSTTKDI